jgi:uncharacterized OB-fold protein
MAEWLGAELIIPPNDPWHQEYFEQQSGGQLKLPRCTQCSMFVYPPRSLCPDCRNDAFEYEALSGKGTVHSYFELTEPIHPAFHAHPKAVVALIELDEQRGVGVSGDRTQQPVEFRAIRMVGNIVKPDGSFEDADNVAVNKRVQVHIVDLGDGLGLPQWELSDEAPEGDIWQIPG